MFGPPSNNGAGLRFYEKVVTRLHRRVRLSILLRVFKSESVLDGGQGSDTHTNSARSEAKIGQNDVWLLALEKVCRVKGEKKESRPELDTNQS